MKTVYSGSWSNFGQSLKTLAKPVLTFVLICFVPFLMQAQKGKYLIEGGMNLSAMLSFEEYMQGSSVTSTGRGYQINFLPQAGYFVTDKFAVGLLTQFSYANYTNYHTDQEEINLTAGPYFRYYFGKSNIRPFLTVDAGYGYLKTNGSGKYKGFVGDGGFGTLFFFSKNLAINTQLLYNYSKLKNDGYPATKAKANGVKFIFGVALLLGKDKE